MLLTEALKSPSKRTEKHDDEVPDNGDLDDEKCPTIVLTKEEKWRLRLPWKNALIIKLFDKKLGYELLIKKLRLKWNLKGDIALTDVGCAYYIVRFHNLDDYEFVMTQGPWIIGDSYLTIRKWVPNFIPDEEPIRKLTAWVRIPNLSVEYFDNLFLHKIGSKIGKVMCIDKYTKSKDRGQFVRFSIEVDLSKPLLSKFRLNGRIWKIQYEGLWLICFKCGKLGHKDEQCDQFNAPKSDEVEGASQGIGKSPVNNRPEVTYSYGSWMIVQRSSRKPTRKDTNNQVSKASVNTENNAKSQQPVGTLKKSVPSNGQVQAQNVSKSGVGSGSRFAILQPEDVTVEDLDTLPRNPTKEIVSLTSTNQEEVTKSAVNLGEDQSMAIEINSQDNLEGENLGQDAEMQPTIGLGDNYQFEKDNLERVDQGVGNKLSIIQKLIRINRPSSKEVSVVGFESHNQHLTVEIKKHGEDPWLFSTVYASPHSALKKQLRNALYHIKNIYSGPWLIAGDFNDTKSLSERNGSSGLEHTWSKGNSPDTFKSTRLDRGLVNEAWQLRFEDGALRNLPKSRSDHCPILISTSGFAPIPASLKPFRFQAAWMNHEKVDAFVHASWDKVAPIIPFLRKFAYILNKWNNETFHNIFRKESELWARLEGIQKRLSTGNDRHRLKLEAMLRREMDDVNNQEEILWFQKSRIDAIRNGDRNTKFFHLSTLIRRRQNRIETLQNSQGEWLTCPKQVKSLVLDFWKSLFQEEATAFTGERLLIDQFPYIEKEDWDLDTVAPNLIALVKDVLEGKTFPEGLNDAFLVLIPKMDVPQKLNHFRPIGLCNIIYKIVTKRKQGKHGIMAVKIDFEKAYDRLRWSFIRESLLELRLPQSMVDVVMKCVTSTKLSILWNGEPTASFFLSRGIRQGDLLSPYLYVICMERLAHLIEHEVRFGAWKAARASRNGPYISHLAFADDLILFCEASADQELCMKGCLEKFCKVLGSKVSFDKSCVFFSENTEPDIRGAICDSLNMQYTEDLGRYQRVPTISGRTSKQDY
ncbi:uncharacterized protein LOC110735912 [Chenopodium quinoa]|uniref:uncharacterized protein LOC110735912 n=1 Tax=Chenopodium quinoa TaxID=63459 RepID=UPI000B78674C|nr:uncharacterized protein LOC110735912 [Chenopodium quinoa]